MEAADRTGFAADRIMLEFTEGERITDVAHVKAIITEYKARNLITAIDDFGAGFSGLGLLADFRPDVIKLDMGLIRGIDQDSGRQAIVSGIVSTCKLLGVNVIAEGIETVQEMQTLEGFGIDLMQGYLFARPAVQSVPAINWPVAVTARTALRA